MLLIKNANVYSPAPLGLRDILICAGRIIELREGIDYSLPQLTVLDAGGKRVLPGFIDQHVHCIGGGGEDGFASRVPELDIRDCIGAGVTTLCGLLGTDRHTRSLHALLAKVRALTLEGITAYCLTGSYEYPSVTLTGEVGEDVCLIPEVLGVKIALSDHRCSYPTVQELTRLASEVRIASLTAKKPGVVHIHVGSGKEGIAAVFEIVERTDIPVRHFRPTHMCRHLDQAAKLARMGGYPDLTSGEGVETALLQLMECAPFGQVTLSSDSNGSAPIWNEKKEMVGMGVGRMTTLYETVRALIGKGVPLERAILPITETVAKALELYPRKGAIAPGSDADLVFLNDDLSIDTVLAKGQVMMKEGDILATGYYASL